MGFSFIEIIISIVILVLFLLILLIVKTSQKKKYYSKEIEYLDLKRNEIDSIPILSELNKVETIIKNEMMEDKYHHWNEEYNNLKENNLIKLNDLIVELIMLRDNKDKEKIDMVLNEAEYELYKAHNKANTLLNEIKEINLSEEKYRTLITKLKSKYRDLNNYYNSNVLSYKDLKDIILLQFENVERRFQDFEEFMDKNEYNEVVHIVKAIDTMIDHLDVVVHETPELVTLSTVVIPRQIEMITDQYEEMIKLGYKLSHLNITSNMEMALKNVNVIMDRIKVLNLVDAKFELVTMMEYLETFFKIFDDEKKARKDYEKVKPIFDEKLIRVNKGVSSIYKEIDDVKNTYIIDEKDIIELEAIKKDALTITAEYKKIVKNLKKDAVSFKDLNDSILSLLNSVSLVDERMILIIGKIGNLYDDEKRAFEQSKQIDELLFKTYITMRDVKLPNITNDYITEYEEALDALKDVKEMLKQRPKSMDALNIKVDLARDLAIKIYDRINLYNEYYVNIEGLYVYASKYSYANPKIQKVLFDVRELYYAGQFKKTFELLLQIVEELDPEIRKRLI